MCCVRVRVCCVVSCVTHRAGDATSADDDEDEEDSVLERRMRLKAKIREQEDDDEEELAKMEDEARPLPPAAAHRSCMPLVPRLTCACGAGRLWRWFFGGGWQEEEESEEEEGSSEYETDTSDSDDEGGYGSRRPVVAPTFVRKQDRDTIRERERKEQEEALQAQKVHFPPPPLRDWLSLSSFFRSLSLSLSLSADAN